MSEEPFLPLTDYQRIPEKEMTIRSASFYAEMKRRRTVREFSDDPVDRTIIENCVRTAGTAPSGANQQPWRFVVVSNREIKSRIRHSAEKVEADFYNQASTQIWRSALKKLKTGPRKPFLETAPYLIVIFSERYHYSADNEKIKHYYVSESVGIATGMLITALHHAGLVTLTYTPANMLFLNQILSRPAHEKPFMILVVGYPAIKVQVPAIQKKTLEEISLFM